MRSKGFVTLALALAIASGARGAAAAGAQAGEVLALFGASTLSEDGKAVPLKIGDPVHVGDVIAVDAGAKLKLRMIDGSVIAAASGTRVTIASYAADAQHRDAKLDLAAGLLRAVVSKAGPDSSFEVDTATGVAAVRSTDWFIEAQPRSTQVGVLSGVVTLASRATGRDVRIPARWGARVEAGLDPVPARVWSTAEFDADISRTNLP